MVLNMIGHRERWIKLLPQTRSSEVNYSLLIMTGMVKTLERSEVQPDMAPMTFPLKSSTAVDFLYAVLLF
jgi:hypothetical protein